MRNVSSRSDSPRAMARVVALLLAVRPEGDPREERMLRDLDVCGRLGLSEQQFQRIVHRSRRGKAGEIARHGYPLGEDLELIDELLDGVHSDDHRLMLCRIASCLITLDGHIEELERSLYDRMLLRWGYTRSSVSHAILARHVH